MSPKLQTGRSLRTLVPVVVLGGAAIVGFVGWLVYAAAHPPTRSYIVTPENFQQLSEQGLRATEEQWVNRDGTRARGWLLRGKQSAPAVIFLHPYGGNRSYYLNLGIKLNEATGFTVLWTDARGHGATAATGASFFGAREAEDVGDAIKHLRALTTRGGEPLVGGNIGLYGVEMGAYSALVAATGDQGVRALVLDSVPDATGDLLRAGVAARTGLDNDLIHALAGVGARVYSAGAFPGRTACEAAAALNGQRVLLLAGADAGALHDATRRLEGCFPAQPPLQSHLDLPLTGLRLASANSIAAETYDRRVIEFFDRTLRDNL